MSTADCIGRLSAAAGRQLSDDEVRGIFERIHRAALDIKAGRASVADVGLTGKVGEKVAGTGGDTLFQQAAQRAAIELMHEAQVTERQANLQVLKLRARVEEVDALIKSGVAPLDAVEKMIVRDYSGRGNVESLEQRSAGHRAYFGSKLLQTWDALGKDYLGFFQDEAKLLLLIRELRGEATGNVLAKRGAEAFHKVAEEARVVFNAAGGDIGRLDDWGMPQHHSQEKVASAGRDAWIDALLPMLDRQKYVDELGAPWSDAVLRDFLGKAWQNIATDGHGSAEAGRAVVSGKRANRHAESRQIHFKDADSVINYWNQFGDRTAVEILGGHVDTMARDIAFIEQFGPNPNLTYQTLRDMALRNATTDAPTKTPQLAARAARLDTLYDYASGKVKPTANITLRKVADGVAALNVAGKLGGAVMASLFGDKPMMEAVSHMNDMPVIQRWTSELALLSPSNKTDRRILQQQGLMLESVRSGLQRFNDTLGSGTAMTGKIANAVMRITGMQAINDIRKGAFGLNLFGAIGNELATGKTFADLADSDVRTLRNYGITEGDWKIWQLAQRDTVAGVKDMLTPEALGRVPDAQIIAAAPAEVTSTKAAYDTQIAELTGRMAKDQQRVAARKQGFADLQDRINRAVKEFAGNREKAAGKTIADLDGRIDEALGDLADVRESTAEGAGAVRAKFDQAVADAQQIGALRQRMRDLAGDARAAIGEKAENAKARIEAYREAFTTAKGWRWDDPWMKPQLEKFHGIQDDINRAVREYAAGKEGRLAERLEVLQGRADDLLNNMAAHRQSAADAMRASVNAVDQAARGGREFGAMRERIRVAARDAQRAIEAKAADAGERIEAVRESLKEYEAEVTSRQDRRQAVIDRLTRERDEALEALPEQLRRNAIVKLLGAVNTESEFAIVTPGWKERVQFYGDGQRGTVGGEIMRAVLQFKSFPWSVLRRGMDAVANQDGPTSKAVMTSYLLASTTLAGAMLMQTREVLSGKDPRAMIDKNWWKFWGSAFLNGGALGIFGDFLYSVSQTRYGSGPIEALAGPTIGPLLELAVVQPLTAAKKRVEGKDSHFLAQTAQDLKGFVPGGNIWYAKAAMDHLVWQRVFEMLSPGYLANIRSKTAKEYGQDWWWRPGETAPERAPDLSRAVAK